MSSIETTAPSRRNLWIGYAMSGLAIAFFVMDFGIKFANLPVVDQTNATLGWAPGSGHLLGVILLVCTAFYAWPRTAVLGAVLLTGYLGGAVATHIRVGNPLFSHVLFGVYLGLLMWGGLWLREPRLRAIFPLR
ncbi:MAG TPA: DoxX family protein [Rhizomicrobium sp.]|jgi:hypothetical protein|nr:DoxX family protein [Rhizomicrobium sp.]